MKEISDVKVSLEAVKGDIKVLDTSIKFCRGLLICAVSVAPPSLDQILREYR